MIRVLVIGDLHFKVNNATELIEVSNQLINIAKDKKPDMIVVLGDVLDTNDKIHLTPLTNATNLLQQLCLISPLYIIMGNHDYKNYHVFMTNEHPFNAFKLWPNTTIIDTTQIIIVNNFKFIMVPYVPVGKFNDALLNIDTTNVVTLFCHQEFKGAKMGPILSTNGDEWDKTYVISGHIHDYQQINDNILYLGTPIQHKYGDDPYKIIGLFTFTKPLTTHSDVVVDKIKLNIPTKKIIHLTPEQIPKYTIPIGVNPQIIITGEEEKVTQILKHVNINKWRKKGIKIITKYNYTKPTLNITKTKLSFNQLLYDHIKNDIDLLNLYNELHLHIL